MRFLLLVSIFISFDKWTIYEFLAPSVSGDVTTRKPGSDFDWLIVQTFA